MRLRLLVPLALLLAACGGGAGPAVTTAAPVLPAETTTTAPIESTTTVVAETTSTAAATTTTTSTAPAGTLVEMVVANGEVTGGGRVEVDLGEQVVLRVTSDVADEVHIHGYDLRAEVAAGGTIEIAFAAEVPGVFEVELEGLRLPLVDLEVGG
jgi:hypothetical protein